MKLLGKNRRNDDLGKQQQKLLSVVIDKNLNFDMFLIYGKKPTGLAKLRAFAPYVH